MNVTLIDYGAGNVTSVQRALLRLGAETTVTNRAEEIAAARCLILPGVGHFGALIRALDRCALRKPVIDAISSGVPFLGICLGLQALYEASDEAPELAGFGLLKGRITLLPNTVKLPHMGWNQVQATRASRLLQGISPEAYFYFAHSYAAPTDGSESTVVCNHGREFVAVIECQNVFGVQFHPEKSAVPGAGVLANFLRIAA